MKSVFRFTALTLLTVCIILCTASCHKEETPEYTWANSYEEHLNNKFSFVTEVMVRDLLDSRQLSVYVVCAESEKEDVLPVFQDFYNYIFVEDSSLRDIIDETNPYISIVFQLKNDIVLKYVCNYPTKFKEKWSVFVNGEFDSYYFLNQ